MAAQFKMADLYGPSFGYATTRAEAVPEQNDQEALQDSTVATADVQTEPVAKRNMVIALIVVVAIMILFSIKW